MTHPAEELHSQPTASPAPPAAAPQVVPSMAPILAPAVNDPRRKKPFLASILSIMPGLGQVYVGYYKRGFINAIGFALLVGFVSAGIDPLVPLVAIFMAFFYLYNIVDAGRRAALYNQALAGGAEIELPKDFEAPGLGGSIAGGVALVVIGLIILSHTAFGASLEWLESWWPLAVVGFGAWLLIKAIQDKAAEGESESLD